MRIIHVSLSEEKANYPTIGGKVPELGAESSCGAPAFYIDLTKTHPIFPTHETDFVVTFAPSTRAKRQCGLM
jgi:hypothetical protein